MRLNAISWTLSLTCLGAGCSFIDDFDRFKGAHDGATTEPGSDGGSDVTTELDAGGTDRDDAGNVKPNRDGGRGRDGGGGGGGGDANVPPLPDGGPVVSSDAGGAGSDASAAFCGDGNTDPGEQCDDGNDVAGDGCEPVTCTNTPSQTCGNVSCNDDNSCTLDVCNQATGCSNRAIDADGDNFSPGACKPSSGLTGGDCNDKVKAIHPGAPELCDGVDNNCNGMVDEGLPVTKCYPDADGDGFPNLAGVVKPTCATTCPVGTLAVADPKMAMGDCYDDPDGGAQVFPGQTKYFEAPYGVGPREQRSYDYNCSGGAPEPELKSLPNGGCPGVLNLLLCGDASGYDGPAPACGEDGDYVTCGQGVLNDCSGTSQKRTQRCR